MILDEVFAELARLRGAGESCCVATVVRVEAPTSAKPGDKAVISPDGRMVGWIGGSCSEASIRREAQRALLEGESRLVRIEPDSGNVPARAGEVVLGTSCPSGGTLEIFLEPHLARPQLVAIGRSPVAKMLIRLAAVMGFRTCGIDPVASPDDFPGADTVSASMDLRSVGVGLDSWIVVATMGHYDEEALEAALATDAAYVGLVASRRRRKAVVHSLRHRGWPGDALSGIVNPAGRMLGDAQEDIALSVLADIVDRRNRRQTRERPAGQHHEEAVRVAEVFATDPVCGMAVEIAGARHVLDNVYFCGPSCREAYVADPGRFSEMTTA